MSSIVKTRYNINNFQNLVIYYKSTNSAHRVGIAKAWSNLRKQQLILLALLLQKLYKNREIIVLKKGVFK